ncbi:hypothetical protein [Roseicella frigidaeris]|uniref:Uncharacterized protein n=1 Tax=Roseicella frigidaeris TaxID=2230885 RepID=A0A327M8L1_9PROT|nr:hypothetical protein [Roseicella frigidaeris]RAI59651.1 hypothetical protein DOO78_08675 [Roseicella frigidaeris]
MQALLQAALTHAFIVAPILFLVGLGLGSLGLDEPAVIAILGCGMLLMFRAALAPENPRA